MIGKGGFAKVFKCELDGQTAVAKIIDSDKINDEMTYLLTNECTIWSRLSHPNITGFYGMASTANSLFLVCEFFPSGSLLERNQRLRRSKAEPPTMVAATTMGTPASSSATHGRDREASAPPRSAMTHGPSAAAAGGGGGLDGVALVAVLAAGGTLLALVGCLALVLAWRRGRRAGGKHKAAAPAPAAMAA